MNRPPCDDCGQQMSKHKIVRINGHLEWCCPDDKIDPQA